jgi:hypothetical protein
MTKVADPTLYWAVLARPRGEVLTAEADSPGLHLGLLGVPPGLGAAEAERWLYDVIAVAHESRPAPAGSRPIPTLLHHAMTGLLFSHGELWERPDDLRPCSFAFAHTMHEVGFGWVGEAEITLWVDGQPRDPEWVSVRDEAGRQARAWRHPSDHTVQVKIVWRASPGDAAGAEVEAVWTAATGLEADATGPSMTPIVETAAATGGERPAAADSRSAPLPEPQVEHADPSEGAVGSVDVLAEGAEAATPLGVGPAGRGPVIARWLRRGFSWFSGRRTRAGEEPEQRRSEEETPIAGEPDEPFDAAGETTGQAPAPVPDLIPPTLEPPTVTRSAVPAPTRGIEARASAPPVWRGVPERIPPSPEPAELTNRTVAWVEPPDPHLIELPPPSDEAADRPPSTVIGRPPSTPGAPVAVESELAPPPESLPESSLESSPAPREMRRDETAQAAVPTPVVPPAPALDEAPLPAAGAPVDSVATAPPPAVAPAPSEPAATPPGPEPEARPVRAPYYIAPPQRPAWPTMQQLARPGAPLWRRPWAWALAVMALFVVGWLVGAAQDAGHSRDTAGRGALGGALHALGLGGPRFVVNVNSRPPGAWISVDGKTLALRTPAVVELTPGEHTIGLSFSDLGGTTYTVRGLKGERVPLDATLWGALEVFTPNEVGIIGVAVDGEARGLAPLRVDSLGPGVHEVRFSGPGMASWGQTVDIRVGETKELLAHATPSPASGVLQVEASLTDEQGTQPLKGGQVWIDGEPRGTTPLTLDLPRGPHSVRLVYKGQQAPIQVLDLPGGNQRFAVFEFGMDLEVPQLIADVPPRIPRDRPAVVSASLAGVGAGEVREIWLHAQTADGPWRRYAMALLKASGGVLGVGVFPPSAFDGQGRARYYLSAQYGQGDESFTEIRTVQLEKSAGR